jgi:hypothetical protein
MASKILKVDTSPEKAFLIDSFSKDASVADCIFDLIDNSIDAARAHLLQNGLAETLKNGLLDTYTGIEIDVKLDGTGVCVADNSGGIPSSLLQDTVLRFGHRSSKPYAIGLYGVGLNRAIFKLGKITLIESDTGSEYSRLELDMDSYRIDDDEWLVEGQIEASTGNVGTKITISSPPGPIQREISDSSYADNLRNEAAIRYCRYLQKGLRLLLNGIPVKERDVKVRSGGPFGPLTKSFTLPNGIQVDIEAGQHEEHRFTREPDHDAAENKKLTPEFGWSIICNDRVIIRSDRTPKTGWEKNWHGEFNGFVGAVSFSAADGKVLPWNTPKNDIVETNEAYQSVLSDMRAFTQQWRNFASKVKRMPKAKVLSVPPPISPPKSTPTPISRPKTITKPSGYRSVLPQDVNELFCKDKVLDLVHEAKRHDLYQSPYSGMALLRMLFEVTCSSFFIRHGKYKAMLAFCVASADAKMATPMTPKQKADFAPSLSQLLAYLDANYADWEMGNGKLLKPSLDKFKHHKSELNSAIHHPVTPISAINAAKIRDEVMAILRHFIEK